MSLEKAGLVQRLRRAVILAAYPALCFACVAGVICVAFSCFFGLPEGAHVYFYYMQYILFSICFTAGVMAFSGIALRKNNADEIASLRKWWWWHGFVYGIAVFARGFLLFLLLVYVFQEKSLTPLAVPFAAALAAFILLPAIYIAGCASVLLLSRLAAHMAVTPNIVTLHTFAVFTALIIPLTGLAAMVLPVFYMDGWNT